MPRIVIRDKGLGDTLERVIKKVFKKPCKGCGQRKDYLNKLIPYKKRK